MYGAFHKMSVITTGANDRSTHLQKVVVAGPLCESGDVFTQEEGGYVRARQLPACRVGDFIVIHDTGAYGASMSSNYNSRLLAKEILYLGKTEYVIRERQTFDALLQFERTLP